MSSKPRYASLVLIVLSVAVFSPAVAQESRMVEAGGHRLHMEFKGVGSPAVVFDAGMNGITQGWGLVRDSVAVYTQTVVFERAGFGDSDVGPSPRDARQLSRELFTALENAGVEFPVILVGHSAGGLAMMRDAVVWLRTERYRSATNCARRRRPTIRSALNRT